MSVQAYAKGVQQTPRKVGLVASLVRGRTVEDALVILEHTPKRAAEPVAKAIESAAANAVNNNKMKRKNLVITRLEVGHGVALKRYRPAARGMAKPYKRRSSNILVVVDEIATEAPAKSAPTKKPATKSTAKKTDSNKSSSKKTTKKPASKSTKTKAQPKEKK